MIFNITTPHLRKKYILKILTSTTLFCAEINVLVVLKKKESKNLLREVGKNIRFISNKSGVNAKLNKGPSLYYVWVF